MSLFRKITKLALPCAAIAACSATPAADPSSPGSAPDSSAAAPAAASGDDASSDLSPSGTASTDRLVLAPAEPVSPAIGGERARALTVPGFADAVVHVPVSATTARPVVVATHGNYDTPEYQCHVWGQVVKDRAFVLCPRGVRRTDSPSKDDPRFEYASNFALEKELDAGLGALRGSFPDRVLPGPVVFTGFSLGAIMGVTIASRRPELIGGMVLVEGGDKWTIAAAKKLAAQKARVLFACSQPSCSSNAKAAIALLARTGVEAALVSGKNEGHTYGGSVRVAYAARFPWVVEHDPRWQPSPAPP